MYDAVIIGAGTAGMQSAVRNPRFGGGFCPAAVENRPDAPLRGGSSLADAGRRPIPASGCSVAAGGCSVPANSRPISASFILSAGSILPAVFAGHFGRGQRAADDRGSRPAAARAARRAYDGL